MGEPFKDLRILYDGLGRTAVSWTLDPRFDDPYPHTFELHFSPVSTGFDTGEYYIVGSGDKVDFLLDVKFRDAGLPSAAFYRVKLTTPAGQYYSPARGLQGNVNDKNLGLVRELLRKENLALRNDRGAAKGFLFKRRYYGPPCSCTDKNTGILVHSMCRDCAGTGFKDGYFPGVEFPILAMSTEDQRDSASPAGPQEIRAIEARCLAFPAATSRDLWMEADTSRLYEVKDYSIIGRLGLHPVAAKMQLRELPLVDIVPLLVSLNKEASSPPTTAFATSTVKPPLPTPDWAVPKYTTPPPTTTTTPAIGPPGPPGPQGPTGPTGPAGGVANVPVSAVTASTYAAVDGDYYLGVNYAGLVTVTLPVAPANGRMIIVKDESGQAGAQNRTITILPAAGSGLIDGAASAVLNINNGALQFVYRNGWRIV